MTKHPPLQPAKHCHTSKSKFYSLDQQPALKDLTSSLKLGRGDYSDSASQSCFLELRVARGSAATISHPDICHSIFSGATCHFLPASLFLVEDMQSTVHHK